MKTKLQVQVKKRPTLDAKDGAATLSALDAKDGAATPPALDAKDGAATPPFPDDEDHEIYDSALDAIYKIIDKAGIQGLYSGMVGSLLGVATFTRSFTRLRPRVARTPPVPTGSKP